MFLVIGEINRFLHIYWNAEYASKVDNIVAFKLVIVSKLVITSIVIIIAYFDPSILKCDTIQLYVCDRKVTAYHRIVPMGLSFIIMISVSIYFVRKVHCLSKVHPISIIQVSEENQIQNRDPNPHPQQSENVNTDEENVVRRLNQNPYQFFKVKISKTLERIPAPQGTFPMLRMVKKALIVNLVTLCQFAMLFPLCLVDVFLLLKDDSCDNENFVKLLKLMVLFGVFCSIGFPISLEKKLDKFCL